MISPKLLIVSLFSLVILAASYHAHGRPVAYAGDGEVRVTLHDDPCALDVKLPYRIVWQEKGKTFEGCFGIMQGVVVAYFSDKSVALFPGKAFQAVTEL